MIERYLEEQKLHDDHDEGLDKKARIESCPNPVINAIHSINILGTSSRSSLALKNYDGTKQKRLFTTAQEMSSRHTVE